MTVRALYERFGVVAMKRTILLSVVFFVFSIWISIDAGAYDGVSAAATGPGAARQGDVVDIEVKVVNIIGEPLGIIVEQKLDGPFVSSDGELVESEDFYRPPFIRWNFTLGAGEERTLAYSILAAYPGEMIISGADVYVGMDELVRSNSIRIPIGCNQNGICESEGLFENYQNCPADCTTGIEGGGCDLIEDGLCDPDCEAGYDPDCASEEQEHDENLTGQSTVDASSGAQENGDTGTGAADDGFGGYGYDSSPFFVLVAAFAVIAILVLYTLKNVRKMDVGVQK